MPLCITLFLVVCCVARVASAQACNGTTQAQCLSSYNCGWCQETNTCSLNAAITCDSRGACPSSCYVCSGPHPRGCASHTLVPPSSQDSPGSEFRSFQFVDNDRKVFITYDSHNMSLFNLETNTMTHIPKAPAIHMAHDRGCMSADGRFVFVYATAMPTFTIGIWMFEVANSSNIFLWGNMGNYLNSIGAGCAASESGVTANSRLMAGGIWKVGIRYPTSVLSYLNRTSQTAFELLDGYGFPTKVSADGRYIYMTRLNAPTAVGYWDALRRTFVPLVTQASNRVVGPISMNKDLRFGAVHSDQMLDANGPPAPNAGSWDVFLWRNSSNTYQIVNRNRTDPNPGCGPRPVATSVSVVWEDARVRDGAEARLAVYNMDDGSVAELPGMRNPFTSSDDGQVIIGREVFGKPIFNTEGRTLWTIVCRRAQTAPVSQPVARSSPSEAQPAPQAMAPAVVPNSSPVRPPAAPVAFPAATPLVAVPPFVGNPTQVFLPIAAPSVASMPNAQQPTILSAQTETPGGLPAGAIVGIIFGVIAVVAAVAGVAFYLHRKNQGK